MEQEKKSNIILTNEPVHDQIGKYDIVIPQVYAPLFVPGDIRKFVLSSGRISGKTSILVQLIFITLSAYPQFDIVVLQATASEIKDSIINEIRQFYENKGFEVSDKPNSEVYIPKSNEQVVFNDGKTKGTINFFPITDSKGGQRTRGIKTNNPISLVLFEEVQKNRDSNVVDQAVATFVRQSVDLTKYPSFPGTKIVLAGNNETEGHWFTKWVKLKRKDKTFKVIYANYKHIWNLLNDDTKEYILQYKKVNPGEYRRMFLGDTSSVSSDVVFPQFVPSKDYLTIERIGETIGFKYIIRVFIGIDHATANDKFCCVPVAVLDDGTCQTLEVLVDDPKKTGRVLSPEEQCNLFDRYMYKLEEKYGFSENGTPVALSIDGAAAPFIAQLRHQRITTTHKKMWRNIKIMSFTQKKKQFNISIIQNAFAYGVVKILNEGRTDIFGRFNAHVLKNELISQRWKNGKLDDRIENDCTDAFEYGLVPFYTNCYNMSYPFRADQNNKLKEMRNAMIYERGGRL